MIVLPMQDIDLSKLKFSEVVVANNLKSARDRIVAPILTQATGLGYGSQDCFALRLGLEEAINNAYRHGNRCQPNRKICARWAVDPDCIVVYVADEGEGFHPETIPDPRSDENLEKPSGRGIMLMKAYMSDLKYNQRGNEVCLIKTRKR